jgi:undecaprenyl pyrophosphate phosphatase UppP
VGLEKFVYWIKAAKHETGTDKLVPLTFSILGLFSPIFHPFSGLDGGQRKILAKFVLFLSLPALGGIVLRYIGSLPADSNTYLHNLDAGIALLVGSLIIRITVDFLEIYFRWLPLEKLFAYYRVALGIMLISLLTVG